ncbi:MAG: M1 family metallopeptidase [Ilumatobacteraceae bacterium]
MTDGALSPHRLPREVRPHRYSLALEPDLAAASFVGHVVIDATVERPVDRIVMHAADLEIRTVHVEGREVECSLDPDTERLTILGHVPEGPVSIEISFAGVLNDKLCGWYRSTFRDADGHEHVIAASQMQATDCRRAFPCFDEPEFKAVFDVTLVIEPDLLAVSNGPEVERLEQPGGKVAVRFAPTMPMSTYLVAFVVGPLEATEPVLVPRVHGGDPIPLRIVHVPGKSHLTAFGLDVGRFAIDWYERYYGIPYPTEKCDMIALPDFAAGAMENLGCITYRESLLLADPAASTQVELQNLADVITHELAHMWFGDLVTMRWWNGIWLNEAFATFMEVACCADYRPEWERWTSFSLERSAAFEVDSLASTRSVEFPVEAPEDCEGMFDVLTYQKGGSLLRMLEQCLGPEAFRRGVSHYLTRHEYANTETADLWDAIEAVNPDTPVRRLMDSWIWQPGYPLVTARLVGSTLVLDQHRYAYGDSDDDTLFVVPLHVRLDGVEHKVILDEREVRIDLPSADCAVVVNAGGHGFVRVAYDSTLRARLERQLTDLGTVDRYNLVDDAWNEVVAGRLGAADLLDFLEGFVGERDLAVWQVILQAISGVGRLVEVDSAAYAALQSRTTALLGPALADLGWEPVAGETDLRAKLRGLLVTGLAVLGGDLDAVARCREILEHGTDPELVAASTRALAAHGTDDDYDQFLHRFRTAETPQEQLRFMYALAEFPDEAQIRRTIELAFSGEVKTQNAPFLLNRCITNRRHGVLAWREVQRRWTEATTAFPDNSIVRMVDPVKVLTDRAVVTEVQGFFSEHPIPQAATTLAQVLERQRVNADLRDREADALAAALAAS